jgi:transposase-like protein
MSNRGERAQLFTAADAAAAIGVQPATLRDWVRRGLLTRHGTQRTALYDVHELVAAADAAKPRRDTPTTRALNGRSLTSEVAGATLPASQPEVSLGA